jgi:hypothetical protein
LFIARRLAYEAAGGHRAIRSSRHDGLKLPRAFRRAGLRTDLFDATEVAVCRMYRGAAEVWNGFVKNAGEGLAAPGLIVPVTLMLVLGQLLPLIVTILGSWSSPTIAGWGAIALAVSYYPRLASAVRFRQSLLGAMLHPLGVLTILAIQWHARLRAWTGRSTAWKGRHEGRDAIDARAQARSPRVLTAASSATWVGLVAVAAHAVAGFLSLMAIANAVDLPPPDRPTPVGRFVLEDQFGRVHQLSYPRPTAGVITVADRRGSRQVDGWTEPLSRRYGDRIEITGVANVSGVPRGWRNRIRDRFKERLPRPVLLDWDGAVAGALGHQRHQVSVLVVDADGNRRYADAGPADQVKLERLYRAIEPLLRIKEAPTGQASNPQPPAR